MCGSFPSVLCIVIHGTLSHSRTGKLTQRQASFSVEEQQLQCLQLSFTEHTQQELQFPQLFLQQVVGAAMSTAVIRNTHSTGAAMSSAVIHNRQHVALHQGSEKYASGCLWTEPSAKL